MRRRGVDWIICARHFLINPRRLVSVLILSVFVVTQNPLVLCLQLPVVERSQSSGEIRKAVLRRNYGVVHAGLFASPFQCSPLLLFPRLSMPRMVVLRSPTFPIRPEPSLASWTLGTVQLSYGLLFTGTKNPEWLARKRERSFSTAGFEEPCVGLSLANQT